jgi:hypothetical protein
MTCVHPLKSLEEMATMIENCGIEYGGPGWVSLAMMGLALVIVVVIAIAAIYWLLLEVQK